MTDAATLARLFARHRPTLVAVAREEQLRQVRAWERAMAAEPKKRGALQRKRDDADHAWAEIGLWLLDGGETPSELAQALRRAHNAAEAGWQKWREEDGGLTANPMAAHYLGLRMIDQLLHERFAEPSEERAAA